MPKRKGVAASETVDAPEQEPLPATAPEPGAEPASEPVQPPEAPEEPAAEPPAAEAPQTEGWLPEDTNPINPERPHLAPLPAGPMGEDVHFETNDIEADGTPLIQGKPQGTVEPSPHIDGESDRDYRDVDPNWQHSPAEPIVAVDKDGNPIPDINRHSETSARNQEMVTMRPVKYEPNEATLDPKSGKGTV